MDDFGAMQRDICRLDSSFVGNLSGQTEEDTRRREENDPGAFRIGGAGFTDCHADPGQHG